MFTVDCLLNGENDVKVDLSVSGEADKWFAATRRLRAVLAGDFPDAMDPR
jgi:hypothetical protein